MRRDPAPAPSRAEQSGGGLTPAQHSGTQQSGEHSGRHARRQAAHTRTGNRCRVSSTAPVCDPLAETSRFKKKRAAPLLPSRTMASMDVPASAVVDGAIPAPAAAAAVASTTVAAGNSAAPAAASVSAHEAHRFLLQHKEKLTMNQYWYENSTAGAGINQPARGVR